MRKLMTPEQVKQLEAAIAGQTVPEVKPAVLIEQPAPAVIPQTVAAPPAVQAQTTAVANYEPDMEDLKASLDLFDGGITLPKIKISKDTAQFEIGENEYSGFLEGYVLNSQILNARWAKEINQQKNDEDKMPECTGSKGMGSKYGKCSGCQYEFMNARRNPALKDLRTNCITSLNLYVLLEGNELPVLIKYPATTITSYKAFCVNLVSKKISPLFGAKIRFTLSKEDKNGVKYSIGQFQMLNPTTTEKRQQLKQIAQNFDSAFHRNEEAFADSAEKPF